MDTLIKKCYYCGTEHSKTGEFCSQTCFDAWYMNYQYRLIDFVLGAILISDIMHIVEKDNDADTRKH